MVCGNKFLRFEMTEISAGTNIVAMLCSSSRTFKWKKPLYFQLLLYGLLSHSSLYLRISD